MQVHGRYIGVELGKIVLEATLPVTVELRGGLGKSQGSKLIGHGIRRSSEEIGACRIMTYILTLLIGLRAGMCIRMQNRVEENIEWRF